MVEGADMTNRHDIKQSLVFCLILLPVLAASTSAELSRRALDRIEFDVIPAYEAGETMWLLKSLSALTVKMDADELELVDSELQAQGLPGAGDLLTNCRMLLVQQGITKLPPAHQREILMTIPFLRDSVLNITAEVNRHMVMQDPIELPKSLDGYERAFWEIHVYENQLQNAVHVCEYGAELVHRGGRTKTRDLSDADRDLLDTNFRTKAETLLSTLEELGERKLELRLGRIARAERVLATSDNYIEKIQAAYVIDLDGTLLADALHDSNLKLAREALQEADLADSIEQRADEVRKKHPRLVLQGSQFFTGLHWWLRGRYGRGPDGAGLLKNANAIHNDEALFGLFMPQAFEPPREDARKGDDLVAVAPGENGDSKPENGEFVGVPSRDELDVDDNVSDARNGTDYLANVAITPDYPRRHHYHWMFEYRQISTTVDSGTYINSQKTSSRGRKVKLSRFY